MTAIDAPLRVGQEVPDFKLEIFDPVNHDFSTFSLEDCRRAGKWTILFFYPGDFTFVCASEMADLVRAHETIRELGGELLVVSTDSKYVHLAWHREEKMLEGARYAMGADPTGAVSKLFGVYDQETGCALRGTFLISPAGRLTGCEINYYNVGRSSEELLRRLAANTYLASHPDEACPARWRQGDRTLTPSAKLVGRVHEALS